MATLRESIRNLQQDPEWQSLGDVEKRQILDSLLEMFPGEKPTEAVVPAAPKPEWLQKVEQGMAEERPKTISDLPVVKFPLTAGFKPETRGMLGPEVLPGRQPLAQAVGERGVKAFIERATAGRLQPTVGPYTPEQAAAAGIAPELIGGGVGMGAAWMGIGKGMGTVRGAKELLTAAGRATLKRRGTQQIVKGAQQRGIPTPGAKEFMPGLRLREAGLHGSFNTLVGAVYGGIEALERDDIITRLKAIGEMAAYGGGVGYLAPYIGGVINALKSQPTGPFTKEALTALFESISRVAKPPPTPPTNIGRLALPPAQTRPTARPTPPTGPLTSTPRPMPTRATVPAGKPPLALTGQVGSPLPVPPGPYPALPQGAIPMPPTPHEGGFPVEFPREPITEITPPEAVAPMQTQKRDTVTRMYRQYFAPSSPFRRVAGGKFGPRKSVSIEEIKRAFGDEGEKTLRDLAGVKGSKVRLRTTPKGEERYSWEKGYGLASALKHAEELQPLPTEELVPEVEPPVPEVLAIPKELEPPSAVPVGEVTPPTTVPTTVPEKPALVSAARRGEEIYLSFDLTAKKVPTADEIRESLKEAVPDADFSVVKFAEDVTHTARGIAKYKVDVQRQGTSEQAAAEAYMDLVGQEKDYVGESRFEQAIPLKDRFQKTVDVGLEQELRPDAEAIETTRQREAKSVVEAVVSPFRERLEALKAQPMKNAATRMQELTALYDEAAAAKEPSDVMHEISDYYKQIEPPPPEEVATVEAPTALELPPEFNTPAAQREVTKARTRLKGGATEMTVKADFVNAFRAWDLTDGAIERMWSEMLQPFPAGGVPEASESFDPEWALQVHSSTSVSVAAKEAVKRLRAGESENEVGPDFYKSFEGIRLTEDESLYIWRRVVLRSKLPKTVDSYTWLDEHPQYEVDVVDAANAIASAGDPDAGLTLLKERLPAEQVNDANNAAIYEALNQIHLRTDLKSETIRKLVNQIDQQRGGLPWNWHRNKALRGVHQIVDELGLDKLSAGTKATESDYEILKLVVSKGRVRTAAEMSGEEVQTVLNILKALKNKKRLGLGEQEFNNLVKLATGRDNILHASMENVSRINAILGNRKYSDVLFEVGDKLPPLYVPEKDLPFPYNKIAQLRPVRHTVLDDTGLYALADSYHRAKTHFEREWLGAVSDQLGKVRWQSETTLEPVMRALEGEAVELSPEHQHAVDTLRGMWDRLHRVFNVPKYRRDYAPQIVDWDKTLKVLKSDTPEGEKLAAELNRMGFKASDKPWKIVKDLRTEVTQLQHDYFIPDYVDFFARHRRYDNLKDMLPTIRHPVRLAEIYIRAGAAWKFLNPLVSMARPLIANLQPETRKLAEKYLGEVLGRRSKQEADLAKGLQRIMVAVGQTPDMGGMDAIARMITDATYVQYLGIPRIGSSAQNLTQGLLILPLIGPAGTLRGATRVFKQVDEARYKATVTESLPAESLERPTDAVSRAGRAWNEGVQIALSLFRSVDVFLRRVAFSGGVDSFERIVGSFSTPQDLQGMREWTESDVLRGQLSGETRVGSNAIMRSAAALPAKSPLRNLQELVAGVEDKGLRWKIIQGLKGGDVEAAGNAYGDYVQKSSQFGYGPVESPLLFRGSPVMRIVSTFASYPLNYVHHMERQASLARRAYKAGNYRMATDQTFKMLYYFMSAAGLAKAAEEVLDADIWEWFVTGELPGRVPLWIKRAYNVSLRLPRAALQRQFGGYEEWEEREFQEVIREIGRDFMVPYFQLGVRDLMEARDAYNKGGKDALREALGLRKFKSGEILLPGQRGPRGIQGTKGGGLIRQ